MSQVEGTIFDIRKFSIHDGPGIRTTVFLKGCPLSCGWCHNPESQSFDVDIMVWEQRCTGCGDCIERCPQNAIHPVVGVDGRARMVTDRERCTQCGDCVDACVAGARERVGRRAAVAEVMREIERDRTFYEESGGGVTFSGGEPLSQVNFLHGLLQACRQMELHTVVDTCGYAPWKSFERILPFTDLFLYDLKIMDDPLHRRYTGVSNRLILSNLSELSARGARLVVRAPVIPGVNDHAENFQQLAAFLTNLPCLERVDLLPYHPFAAGKYERLDLPYSLSQTASPTAETMQSIAQELRRRNFTVKIGG